MVLKIQIAILAFGIVACNEAKVSNENTLTAQSQIAQPSAEKVAVNDSSAFIPFRHNLYINAKGEIAFRTVDYGDPNHPHDDFLTTIHPDSTDYDKEVRLQQFIDTASFEGVGDLYFRDKRHVYYHFQMVDGGTFSIVWEADPKTFVVLDNSYYAKDKKYVFYRGSVLAGADLRTFKVLPKHDSVYSWRAKDKRHMYEGEEIVGNEKK